MRIPNDYIPAPLEMRAKAKRIPPGRQRAIIDTLLDDYPRTTPWSKLGGNGAKARMAVLRLRRKGWDIRVMKGYGLRLEMEEREEQDQRQEQEDRP